MAVKFVKSALKPWPSWRDIAEIVNRHRPHVSVDDALAQMAVPDGWLGNLVGVVKLGGGEPTGTRDGASNDEALQQETLVTDTFMCKFRYKHRLQHARRFKDPLSPLNKPKLDLWRASISLHPGPALPHCGQTTGSGGQTVC